MIKFPSLLSIFSIRMAISESFTVLATTGSKPQNSMMLKTADNNVFSKLLFRLYIIHPHFTNKNDSIEADFRRFARIEIMRLRPHLKAIRPILIFPLCTSV